MKPDYRQSLAALEHHVHVPFDEQIQTQDPEPDREYVEPEDLDRARLLANPAGAGRLHPRR